MAEILQNLRLNDLGLEELNRIMGKIQDRLDELEGRRGTPAFFSDVDMLQNYLKNVAGLSSEDTSATLEIPSTFTDSVTFEQPINIPIIVSASKPTTTILPTSGDFAIWQINATNNRLVANVGGTIFQVTLTV